MAAERLGERTGYVLPRLPSRLWGFLALLALLGIPQQVHTLSLPAEPVLAQVLARASRELIVQCLGSTLFLAVFVCRWRQEIQLRQDVNGNAGSRLSRRCLQFNIADLLGCITVVALSLSLWRWSGSWVLAMVLGTCAFQACVLYRTPLRLSIGIAWLAAWVLVGLMVLAGKG